MPAVYLNMGANYTSGGFLFGDSSTADLQEYGPWITISSYTPGVFALDDEMVFHQTSGGTSSTGSSGETVNSGGYKIDFSDVTGTAGLTGGIWGDSLLGGSGADTLDGGAGSDTLIGGRGNDELTGGADADFFDFSGKSGKDVITDFIAGVDTIRLSDDYDVTIANILSHIRDDGNGNAVIALGGGNTITLQGVAKSALTEADFEIENRAPVITVQARADIIVANELSSNLSVLLNGATSATTLVAGTITKDVELGDIDGDGDLDIVAANYFSQNVYVWKGDGLGGLTPGNTLTTDPGPTFDGYAYAVELGDIDDDGDLDMVVALNSGAGAVGVFLNDGAGNFSSMTVYGSGLTRDIAIGDINGDGLVDIVLSTASNISVMSGNGDGTFDAATTFANGTTFQKVELADIDNDGDLDVIASTSTNVVAVFQNFGSGTGVLGSQSYFTHSVASSTSFALGDVNGDGTVDLVTTGYGINTVYVLSGSVGFTTVGMETLEDYATSLALTDVDGDGKLDLVATLANNKVAVLLGDGTGGFGNATTYAVGDEPGAVVAGDLDNRADRVTDEETAIVFDGAHGNAITLSDLDAGSGFETLTLSVEHGTLTLADTNNLVSFSGDGTGTVTVRGYITELNDAIDGLIYTPDDDYFGDDELTLTLDDEGNTGAAKSATTTISIVVNAVSDAPTTADKTVTATEDTALTLGTSTFAFDDVDGDALVAVKIVSLPTSGVLKLNNVTLTAATTVTATDIAAGKLTYTPASNANGPALAIFTFSVQDDSGAASGGDTSATKTVTIDVTAVNDPPTLSLSPIATALKESASTASDRKVADIMVSDVDAGTNVLSLSGADKGLFVIKNGDLYLKAGAKLDFETNPKLDVTIRADDATISGSPDATINFQIKLTDVVEVINGNNGANTLTGVTGAEIIDGKGGDDKLSGGGGADTIIGGAGGDTMTGGAGPDVFRFKPGDLPTVGFLDRFPGLMSGKYDLITDFKPGTDVIDLKAIDADRTIDGNQAFHFKGEGRLTVSKAELAYQLYGTKAAERHTIILGDTDGDGGYDFRIVLKGHHHLDASDFVL